MRKRLRNGSAVRRPTDQYENYLIFSSTGVEGLGMAIVMGLKGLFSRKYQR